MSSNIDLEDDWNDFNDNILNNVSKSIIGNDCPESIVDLQVPTSTDLYISTKTVIAYLKIEKLIDLKTLFWNIPIQDYYLAVDGCIKKQIKMTSNSEYEVKDINKKLEHEKIQSSTIISNIKSDTKTTKYKHVQKINIGISKKDIISSRMKEKGAFYNCFALIIRLFEDDTFKEIHVKIFNTGKLEIPGIQKNTTLYKTMNLLIDIIQPYFDYKLIWKKEDIENVLINSNFSCGYYVNREALYYLLRHKYNIISIFDPCSYPGIQSKFYYNSLKTIQNGICECDTKCSKTKHGIRQGKCLEISFMIFRTGSVLIVGHCSEDVLEIIYTYLKQIFKTEYKTINQGNILEKKPKKSKSKRIKKCIIRYEEE